MSLLVAGAVLGGSALALLAAGYGYCWVVNRQLTAAERRAG